jgi:hypothetical protein
VTPSGPFLPSTNGFAFTNSWPSEPAVSLHTPFGTIGIGNAANGLCGGMVYAALDYWYEDNRPSDDRPVPGSPLYEFLVQRIVDSWNVPVGVAQYFTWMNLPDDDTSFDVFGRHIVVDRGVTGRTITQQWPQIKTDLDHGIPSPLGIVTVRSGQVSDLGLNHQVLAYGYSESQDRTALKVYDPNRGRDDSITITFATKAPFPTPVFGSKLGIDHQVRGFFRSSYAPVPPPGTTGLPS